MNVSIADEQSSTDSSNIWGQFLRSYVPYIVLGFLSTGGNAFLSVIILKNKDLREKYLLLVAHAFGNFCLGAGSFLAGTFRLFYRSEGTDNIVVSHIACLLRPWNWFYILSYHVTAVLSFLIAFERLACVAAPIKYYKIPAKRYIKYGIVTALLYSFISFFVAFPTAYVLEGGVRNICFTEDGMSEIYGLYIYAVETVCGIATIVFYIAAVLVLMVNVRRLKVNEAAKIRLKSQAKITQMMAIVLLTQFFLSVMPNICVFFSIALQVEVEFMSAIIPYCGSAATANSGLNIVFYTLFNSELRPAFGAAFGMKCRKAKVTPLSIMEGNKTATTGGGTVLVSTAKL